MRLTSTCTPCASSTSPIAFAISSVAPCLLADATRTVMAAPPFGSRRVSVGSARPASVHTLGSRAAFPQRLGGRLQQALCDRIPDELRAARETELLHDVRAVRLGGAYRDEELLRDLLVRVPQREEPEHLALAVGERILVHPARGGDVRGDEARAELRVDVSSAARDLAHCGDDFDIG